jgi:capsular polysaccharide biosynthesis protein
MVWTNLKPREIAHELDYQRTIGNLLGSKIPAELSLAKIVQELGIVQSVPLVSELFQLFPRHFSVNDTPHTLWNPLPESLVRAFYTALLKQGFEEEKVLKNFSKHFSNFSLQISPKANIFSATSYSHTARLSEETYVNLSPIPVSHSDLVLPNLDTWNLGAERFEIGRIAKARTYCGTQILLEEDNRTVLADTAIMPGGQTLDFRHDYALIGVTSSQILIRIPKYNQKPVHLVTDGLWLGAPMSMHWGHWVYEFLTRIALYDKFVSPKPLKIVLSSDTPRMFIQSIEFLWPESEIVLLETGTPVELNGAFVINSRFCHPHGVIPSIEGHKQHLSCEPIGMGVLRERILRRVREHSLHSRLPSRVFLSREGAANSRKNIDSKLSEIALKSGFTHVNPGALKIEDEFALAVGLKEAAGLAGSQIIISIFAKEISKLVIVGHDLFDHDSRGFGWCFEMLHKFAPQCVLGARREGSNYRSENSMHKDFYLTIQGEDKFEYLLNSQSRIRKF